MSRKSYRSGLVLLGVFTARVVSSAVSAAGDPDVVTVSES